MAQQPSDETDDALDLTAWQALGPHAARETLLSCCSSPRWADAVVQGRPYAGVEELLEASDQAFGSLTAEDVAGLQVQIPAMPQGRLEHGDVAPGAHVLEGQPAVALALGGEDQRQGQPLRAGLAGQVIVGA